MSLALQWYLRGKKVTEFPQHLMEAHGRTYKLTVRTVWKDIKAAKEVLAEKWEDRLSKMFFLELEKLDTLEKVAWEGLNNSYGDVTVIRTYKDKEGNPVEEKTTTPQNYNPAFIARIESLIDKRLKIIGVLKSQGIVSIVDNSKNISTTTNVTFNFNGQPSRTIDQIISESELEKLKPKN